MKGLLEICYLIGSVTFIVGLKMMGNAKTARKGNLIGAFGMTVAILGTIFLYDFDRTHTTFNGFKLGLILSAIGIGTGIGWMTAKKVEMTKMPELVSMFSGIYRIVYFKIINLTNIFYIEHFFLFPPIV